MKQKGFLFTIILIIIIITTTGYIGYKYYLTKFKAPDLTPSPISTNNSNTKINECLASTVCRGNAPCMTNPASVFCICMGGEEKIVDSASGQSGICTIDRQEYDEWEYLRKFSPPSDTL